jgi:hypothetical protein
MLDGDELPASASGDDELDDLDKYLDELDGDSAGGDDGDVGDDISKYLGDLGVGNGDGGHEGTSDAKNGA